MYRFLFFWLIPLWCFGQIPEPHQNTYVNDYAHALTPNQIDDLNSRLRTLEDRTTVRVAVLLVDSLPPGVVIEDFARDVGNRWKVGVSHNGVVYVAALAEHRQRLEIAERLEGDVPDVVAGEIIHQLRPALQQKDYYGALALLADQLGARLNAGTSNFISSRQDERDARAMEYRARETEFEREKAQWNKVGNYVVGVLVLGAVLFVIWAYRYRKRYVLENTVNGVYIGVGSAYYASLHPEESSDYGGDSGYGDFGGDGGGGFSGGGASDSW